MENIVDTKRFCALLALSLPLLFVLSTLTGCANLDSYKDAAIAAVENANDAEAEIVTRLGCTVDLAAWGRLEDMRVQDGMFYACVPESVAKRYGLSVLVE